MTSDSPGLSELRVTTVVLQSGMICVKVMLRASHRNSYLGGSKVVAVAVINIIDLLALSGNRRRCR